MTHALEDIRVVDLSGSIATAYCGKLFADYGAEVINLESANGFPTRLLEPLMPDGSSAMHAYLSTNKLSVDRTELSDRQIEKLVRNADLVLDDGSSEVPQAPLNMSVSWYGAGGPYSDFKGTDALCFALNGMLRLIGRVDGPPIIPTGYQAQISGGINAFIGSLGYILGRENGQITEPISLETSIYESMLAFTDVGAIAAYNTGIEAPRMGINRYPPTYPLGIFPCKNGWIGLTVLTPGQWHTFCDLLDMPDFSDVPLFQTSVGRLQAIDAIEPIVQERLLGFDAEELFYKGQENRIPLARVPTLEELFSVDQFVERKAFSNASVNGTNLKVPSVPFRLYTTPPNFGGRVAQLGEHTEEVL